MSLLNKVWTCFSSPVEYTGNSDDDDDEDDAANDGRYHPRQVDEPHWKYKSTMNLHNFFYRPQTKLREGNVFTGVCDSVHRVGCAWSGRVWSRGCLVREGSGAGGPGSWGVGGGAPWRPPDDGYCCGRYASYLNAFLFIFKIEINLTF